MMIRAANAGDARCLARRRLQFLREIGQTLADSFESHLHAHLETSLAEGTTLGWVAVDGATIVGTIAAIPSRRLPTAGNPSGLFWYVLNVFVVPSYRGRGISRELLETLITAARAAKIGELGLHATAVGREVYRSFGFVDANDVMELRLR